MQFKKSKGGRTIQIYRSIYVVDKKRSKQVLLLTFPSNCDQIPKSVLEKVKPEKKLTENELKEIQTWLDVRKADREESGLKYSVTDLPRAINLGREGVTKYGIVDNKQAQIIYNSIEELTKAIRKAGFTRLKKEPVLPPKPAPKKKKKTVSKKKVKKAAKKKILKIKSSPGKGFQKDHKKLKKVGKKVSKKTIKKAVKKVSKKTVKKSAGKKTGKP